MSRFSLRFPYFIIVACLMVCVVGITSLARMPVDLFPSIKIPVVVVATFFSGMPPEQIENDITGRFERFFTLGSGIDHIESRSLPGVSLIKIYFQPGTNADSGGHDHLEPGNGEPASPAAGNASTSGFEIRRVKSSSLLDHFERRGNERDAVA